MTLDNQGQKNSEGFPRFLRVLGVLENQGHQNPEQSPWFPGEGAGAPYRDKIRDSGMFGVDVAHVPRFSTRAQI